MIHGHHVYKLVWTLVLNKILECHKNTRTEAKEYDENVIGVFRMKK